MAKRLADVTAEAEKEAGYADMAYFKMKEGDNKMRILTFPEKQILRWDGKKYQPVIKGDPTENLSIKWLMYIIDRDDENKVKLAKLPNAVVKMIQAYQEDEDYAFEDFPMPYDLKITAKDAGSTKVKYAVIPSPKRTIIDEPTLAELLDGKKTCADIVEGQKKRRMEDASADEAYEKGHVAEAQVEAPDEDPDY